MEISEKATIPNEGTNMAGTTTEERKVNSGTKQCPDVIHDQMESLHFAIQSIMALILPVTITMIASALVVNYITIDDGDRNAVGFNRFLVSDETAANSNGDRAIDALVNALIIIGVVGTVTFLMVLLYYLKCTKILTGWLIISVASIFGLTGAFVVQRLIARFQVPVDSFTFLALHFNLAILASVSFFGPSTQSVRATLAIMVSVIMAFVFSLLPEWTTWSLLGFLACYDLCAVLTPCGPLRLLVGLAQDRKDAIPALLYQAKVETAKIESPQPPQPVAYSVVSVEAKEIAADEKHVQDGHDVEAVQTPPQWNEEEEDESIRLGLGDFVFYSVLVARATLFGFTTVVSCIVAILVGFGLTMVFLSLYNKALPALPFSILFGIATYFPVRFFVWPYSLDLLLQGLFI
jgi:presenilin 1